MAHQYNVPLNCISSEVIVRIQKDLDQEWNLLVNVYSYLFLDIEAYICCGSLCRHGIRQYLTNWADGVSRITQCSLQKGDTYTYEFTAVNQSGTMFWHGHVNWLRATVHGALIVHPKATPPYPTPAAEFPLLLGNDFSHHWSPNYCKWLYKSELPYIIIYSLHMCLLVQIGHWFSSQCSTWFGTLESQGYALNLTTYHV